MIKHQKTIGSLFTRAKSALFSRTTPNDSPQPMNPSGSSRLLTGAKRLMLTCCLLGLMSTSANAAVIYLQNFDSGTDGWDTINSVATADYSVLSNTTGGQSGNCLQVQDNGYNWAASKNITGLVAGDTYTLTAYLKIPHSSWVQGTSDPKMFIRFRTSGGAYVAAATRSDQITTVGSWVQATLSGIVPATATQAYIGFGDHRNSTASTLIYIDTVSFTSPGNPCVNVPQVTVAAPLYTGGTTVTVGGVDGAATSVKVYENGIQIGDLTTGITAGNNAVTTSALTEGAVIKATQTVGGQESCIPAAGVTVLAPCTATAAITTVGPVAAGQTSVTVTGVDPAATAVTVYANLVQIGTVSSPTIDAGRVTVTTTALVKDEVISATQTLAGQEGCVPAAGATVGGGANPSFTLALSLRTGSNSGPVGAQGAGSGPLYFLGSATGTIGDGPTAGVAITADGCWQTVTVQSGVDPVTQYSGTAAPLATTGFASLDGIAVKMNAGDTGPYEVYIDDLQNGSVVLQDWETNSVGDTGITFKLPRASGTTSGDLLLEPNTSVVTAANAFTGTNSTKVNWQFDGLGSDNWLRLTTDGPQAAPAIRRPQVDLSQPITFRILVLPVGQIAADNMIATQPQDDVQLPGSNVSFSVGMGSTDPIYSYQWKKNGSDISLATDSALALSNITTGDEGDYSVEITVAGDCPKVVTSRVATLTVPVQPTVSVAADSPVHAGSNIVVTATATGGALSYAWYKDGSLTALVDGGNISGATTDTLTISDVRKIDAGSYKCEVTNLAGSADATAVVAVTDPSPAVIVATPDASVGAGTNLTLTATSIGTGTLTYAWLQNGAAITEANVTGADTDTLTITSATAANAGNYHVVVSNGDLDTTPSDPVAVSVLEAPAIVADLAPETRDAGQTIVYSVTTTGSAATFAWTQNGIAVDELDPRVSIVSTSNGSTLTVSNLAPADEGTYEVTASNVAGSDSSSAYLTVVGTVSITAQPQPVTVGTGTNAVFTVSALGGNLQYQWKLDGNNVGDNSNTLTIALENAGTYSVTVNVFNSVDTTGQTSDSAALTVIAPPTIVSITPDLTLEAGTNATLEVTLGGSFADTITWTFDSATVSTDTTVELTDVSVADMGTYTVTAINFAGTVIGTVNVTVNQAPTIDVQPASQNVVQGGNATFTVQATGNPLNYQWRFNGDDIGGATDSSLTVNNVQTANLGYYSVRVYNDSGSVDSDSATLNVTGSLAFADNFDSYADQTALNAAWTASGTAISLATTNASSVPNSVRQSTIAQSSYHLIPDMAGSNFRYKLRFYDGNGGNGQRIYAILHARTGGTFGGSLQQLIAIGKNNNVSGSKYYGRVAFGAGMTYTDGATAPVSTWFQLGGGPDASIGWHTLEVVGEADPANPGKERYSFYVDGVLGGRVGNAAVPAAPFNFVVLGSAISSGTTGDAFFDDVEVSTPFQPLTITTQPADTTVNVATTASFTVAATSSTALNYQWQKDGVNIAGATDATLTINNAQTADQGSYSVIVVNDAGPVTSGSATLTVIDPADIKPPVLKVLAPKANFVYTDSSLTMTGTVLDVVGIDSLEYSHNEGALTPVDVIDFVAINKASNWTSTLNLTPGTNTVTVVATDRVGQQHTVGPIKFYYHVSSPLTVVTNLDGVLHTSGGIGMVTNRTTAALYDGTPDNLYVGRTYKLQAYETGVPKFAYILTNWTATWEGQTEPVVLQTNNLILNFEMKSNMVINANFISNPFYRFGGTYLGLFSDTNGVAFHSAGYAQIKVTPKLTFSAKLLVDGNPIGMSGKLKIDGTGTATSKSRLKVTDKPELTVDIALDFAGGTDSLSGTISQSGTSAASPTPWSASLLANRLTWSKTNVLEQAQAFTNNYTMQVPGFTNISEGPVGTASGGLKVDVRGKVVVVGTGSDTHPLRQATWISKDGHWPMFSPMYKTKRFNALAKLITETKGFTMGWLQFTTNEFSNLRPEGEVHTIKTGWENTLYTPGWTNSVYVAGFTNAANAVASRWAYDKLAPENTLPGLTRVLIDFTEGDLGASFSNTWDVTVKSTFAPIKTNTYANSEKAALIPTTGVFKSTFIHPVTSAVTKYQGVMLQDYQTGEGSFVGPSNGGKVTVTAAP